MGKLLEFYLWVVTNFITQIAFCIQSKWRFERSDCPESKEYKHLTDEYNHDTQLIYEVSSETTWFSMTACARLALFRTAKLYAVSSFSFVANIFGL